MKLLVFRIVGQSRGSLKKVRTSDSMTFRSKAQWLKKYRLFQSLLNHIRRLNKFLPLRLPFSLSMPFSCVSYFDKFAIWFITNRRYSRLAGAKTFQNPLLIKIDPLGKFSKGNKWFFSQKKNIFNANVERGDQTRIKIQCLSRLLKFKLTHITKWMKLKATRIYGEIKQG